ncbi:hypothetical protein HPP92_018592 [Vanilla planifolia]|uniref:Uncharacterized protein n=1 Tax=Vanilla planifolia TaxID=51239 RepID=A0A835QBE2_VANPL|nr:hypothetical protein HPP92_018592 [Vanilla planifolia]
MADSKSSAQVCVHTDALQLTQYKPACNLAHQEFYSLGEVNITHRHRFLSSPQFPSSPFSSSLSGEKQNREELLVAIESRDDEEEGYQTPTSPIHRIPAIINCPPTPKKPADTSRTRKRISRSFAGLIAVIWS